MESVARHPNTAPASPAPDRRVPASRLYAILFAAAASSFCLGRILDGRSEFVTSLFVVAGSATCGWSWLVARELFRAPVAWRRDWPLAVVLMLAGIEAFRHFRADSTAPVDRMIGNVETLLSSTILLLAMVEPLRSVHRGMGRRERRFRVAFAGCYAMMLAIAVVGIDGASPGSGIDSHSGTIKAICAAIALAGAALAIRYRRANPLLETGEGAGAGAGRRRPVAADDGNLADRLTAAMRDAAVYTRPGLRVADLARRVGGAEYKVTRCITGTLGFRNFNHMINHARIAAAKRRLADPSCDDLPVLTIALDCGFGSIGPFNRAFRAETGTTPMHFRRAAGSYAGGTGPDA